MPGPYGPYGPPFADISLQQTFTDQTKRLANSSAVITTDVARELVATVINSALAAGDASIPKIEARVRLAAGAAARDSVIKLLGHIAFFGLTGGALVYGLRGLARRRG